MLCSLLLYSKVNQLCVYLSRHFSEFPSHLGHLELFRSFRALTSVPVALQFVLIGYLF